MNTSQKLFGLSAGALLALAATAATAQSTTTVLASDGGVVESQDYATAKGYSSTTGSASKYFTLEGIGTAGAHQADYYSTYVPLDFMSSATSVSSVSSVTITLHDEGYASGKEYSGGLDYYVEPDTTTQDFSTTNYPGSLAFNQNATISNGDGTSSVGVDDGGQKDGFTTAPYLLGETTFSPIQGSGVAPTSGVYTPYTYTFTIGSALSTYLASQLTSGGDVRIVIAPASGSNPEASFLGYNPSAPATAASDAPSVTFAYSAATPSAAPEPSEWAAMAFTALGTGGLLLRARRRIVGGSANS